MRFHLSGSCNNDPSAKIDFDLTNQRCSPVTESAVNNDHCLGIAVHNSFRR